MAARRLWAAIGLLLCLLVVVPPSLLSQQKEKLTIEWMNSPESYRIGALPQWRWMPDGSLLWDDPAKPQAERRLEVMDPRTGTVRPFVDTAAALGSIRGRFSERKRPRGGYRCLPSWTKRGRGDSIRSRVTSSPLTCQARSSCVSLRIPVQKKARACRPTEGVSRTFAAAISTLPPSTLPQSGG